MCWPSAFFSQPPEAWEIDQDDWQPEPMSSIQRVAMLATVAPVMAVLAVAIALLFPEPQLVSSSAMSVVPPRDERPLSAVETQARLISTAHAVATPLTPVTKALTQLEVKALERSASPRRSSKTRSAVMRARRLLDADDAQAARALARDAARRRRQLKNTERQGL